MPNRWLAFVSAVFAGFRAPRERRIAQRRVLLGRRSGLDRRIAERRVRVQLVDVDSDRRAGNEPRSVHERRQRLDRRAWEERRIRRR